MPPIDLWTLPLRADPGDADLLDDRERARLDRLRVADKRDQFLAAQAGLRRVLAAYLDLAADAIAFDYGPHGKPALRGERGLEFNLSHSGELAIVAVTAGAEIGADLEWCGRDRPFLRLARRYFDPAEHTWLARRAEPEVRAAFYRIWTLKESFLKGLGTGLTVPPASFRLDLETDPPRLLSTPEGTDPAAWTFATPTVAVDYAAALCWRSGDRSIRERSLPPE